MLILEKYTNSPLITGHPIILPLFGAFLRSNKVYFDFYQARKNSRSDNNG